MLSKHRSEWVVARFFHGIFKILKSQDPTALEPRKFQNLGLHRTKAKGKNLTPVDPWSRTYLKVGACSMKIQSLIYGIRKTKELVQSIDWRKSQKLDEWTDWIFISVSRKFTLSLYQKICQSIVPYGHTFYTILDRTYWEKFFQAPQSAVKT